MATTNRLPHMRAPSMGVPQHPGGGAPPALVTRINEKRAELDNLKQLKELSGNLADQMEALEAKLATLSDGTAAVAAVLANWHNVLQAINMASMKLGDTVGSAAADANVTATAAGGQEPELPQVLVRIPADDKQGKPGV